MVDPFEKLIEGKDDRKHGSEQEIWIAGRLYCLYLPSIYLNNGRNDLIGGDFED